MMNEWPAKCDQLPLFDRLHATDNTDVLDFTVFVFDCGHNIIANLPGIECTALCAALLVPC